MTERGIKVRISNSLAEMRWVMLEPWTGEYRLEAGKSLDLITHGDISLPLEVELSGDTIIVYALDSEGATVQIFRDGVELQHSER